MSGSSFPDPEKRRGLPRISGLALTVAGILALGGGVGLALNRTSAPATAMAEAVPGDPATDPLTPASTGAETSPTPTLVRSVTVAPRLVDVTPPENPFLRTAAEPVAYAPATSDVSVPASVAAAPAPSVRVAARTAVAPTTSAQPVQPAAVAPSNPSADDLALTGIVQGEPPVAVVRYSGQSLFLKIGDQVADTWRLVEIKERSAIFQLGAQRVEIPIKGGSSE